MKERNRLIKLYDIYKNLLTEKQREYFEYYFYEDLSLSEISEITGVSKSFVGKTLNKIDYKLKEYETALSIYDLYKSLEKITKNTKDESTKKEIEDIIK